MTDPRYNPLGYAEPGTDRPPPRRPPARWILLLLVWGLGLAIWALYIGLLAVLVFHFFRSSA